MKIFNASGHPIKQDGVEIVGETAIPNVDMGDAQAVLEMAQAIAQAAAPAARQGTLIALPGLSALAVQTLAVLHGLTGGWPRVAWSARNSEGVFAWDESQTADLHEVRTAAREGDRA